MAARRRRAASGAHQRSARPGAGGGHADAAVPLRTQFRRARTAPSACPGLYGKRHMRPTSGAGPFHVKHRHDGARALPHQADRVLAAHDIQPHPGHGRARALHTGQTGRVLAARGTRRHPVMSARLEARPSAPEGADASSPLAPMASTKASTSSWEVSNAVIQRTTPSSSSQVWNVQSR